MIEKIVDKLNLRNEGWRALLHDYKECKGKVKEKVKEEILRRTAKPVRLKGRLNTEIFLGTTAWTVDNGHHFYLYSRKMPFEKLINLDDTQLDIVKLYKIAGQLRKDVMQEWTEKMR